MFFVCEGIHFNKDDFFEFILPLPQVLFAVFSIFRLFWGISSL